MIKKYLPWVIIFFGIILRFRQYVADRSLWLDEALLARNIIERDLHGLLQPLGYDQNAPLGFIYISKLAVTIGGNTSLALRFFPFLLGILSLFLFYAIAKRLLRFPGVVIAMTLFAFSTPLVYYSAEFKQYMGDVVASLMLWYLFLSLKKHRSLILGVSGAIVLWFSHASMFVLVAIACADPSLWLIAVPMWIASFSGDYLVSLRYNLASAVIQNWQGHFLVFPWQHEGNFALLLQTMGRMFGFFVDLEKPVIPFILLIVGYWSIAKKNIRDLTFFVLPIILLIIASGLQKYPFVPRLLLFLTPSLYIGIAKGYEYIVHRVYSRRHFIYTFLSAFILTIAVLFGTIPAAAAAFITPIKVEELQDVLRYLGDRYTPGDVIYVYYGAEAPFRFYAPSYGLTNAHVLYGKEARSNIAEYITELDKLKGSPRMWVVFSHIYRQPLFGEDRYIVGYLDTIGKRLDYYPQVGASLYLFGLQ